MYVNKTKAQDKSVNTYSVFHTLITKFFKNADNMCAPNELASIAYNSFTLVMSL